VVFSRVFIRNSDHSDDSGQFRGFRIIPINIMRMNTIEDYKKGVKAKYEEAKTAEFSVFLLQPSPAELKNLCILLFDGGLSKLDEEIFNRFFELNDQTDKRKQIEYFNVDKLRPIGNFLKGNTETTRTVSLNLIAVLVDFNPRPFRKFIATHRKEELTAEGMVKDNSIKDWVINDDEGVVFFEKIRKGSASKRIAFAGMLLFVLGSVGYSVKSICFPNKNCMVWVKDHYEAVEYDEVNKSADAKRMNQDLLDNFKKIKVCDTITFFKNGNKEEPLVWYARGSNKGEYDYFNQPGLHPVTGKTLKKITPYIIKKYVLK
jgi:hypothetical protein